MACNVTLPSSYILPNLASKRMGVFMYRKFRTLSRLISTSGIQKNENTCVSYNKDQFKSLLVNLNTVSDVSGVRIYFASYIKNSSVTDDYIPNGDEGKMTLVYAATKNENNIDSDTGDYFLVNLSTNQADKKSFDFVNPWVIAFQDLKIAKLEQIEQKEDPNFKETKNLFFKKDDITAWINVIDCLADEMSIDGIDICFGAYRTSEKYAKKLTLIFSLIDSNTTSALIHEQKLSKTSVFELLSNDYDTGNPCPPNKCNGSSLGR